MSIHIKSRKRDKKSKALYGVCYPNWSYQEFLITRGYVRGGRGATALPGFATASPVNPVPKDSTPLRLCVKEIMSPAAKSVLDAGCELWRYYHAQPGANPNASFYDIRLHFQGSTVDAKGKAKMNSSSEDETYTTLLANLRAAMKLLSRHIEPKVYESRLADGQLQHLRPPVICGRWFAGGW